VRSDDMNQNIGLVYAFTAYTFWGVVPIFWKQLAHIDPIEIVMHRMVWASVLAIALIFILRQSRTLLTLVRQPRVLLRLGVASLLVSANWAIFIWAVNGGHILEVSMGYFINPLITVVFGVAFFGERLRGVHLIAILVMALGVLYTLVVHGEVPLIALSLALTFGLYSMVKKTVPVPAVHGLAVETSLMLLPALIYLAYLDGQGQGRFGHHMETDIMLVLGGLLTLIPLVLFAAAAKRVSMIALGMAQYIGPTLQLLIGVFLYNEVFGQQQLISFGLIWFALAVYSIDQLKQQRARIKARKAAPA